jgi:hypothetical protein
MNAAAVNLKASAIFLMLGVIVGLALGWYWFDHHVLDPAPGKRIIEHHISGPGSIHHRDWNFKGDWITARTMATGESESTLEIPKGLIPEAREWLRATDGLQLMMLFQYYGSRSHLNYSALYFRRRGNWSIGGGPVIGPDTVGFQAGGMVWW